MKITCQSCQSKYTVSDDKVQGRTVKIKCRKCGSTILVNSASGTGAHTAVDPVSTAPTESGSYLVNMPDGEQRTLTLDEIVTNYNASAVTADTYVWADGMVDWQPLGQVEAIVAALNSGAGLTPVQPSYEQPAQPDLGAAQSSYDSAAHSYPAAAQPAYPAQPAYGAAQPAYGQPAPEMNSAAKEPAVPRAARREQPRATADLFAGGMSAQRATDVATNTPLFKSPSGAPPKGDENSMLFSLSALTAKPGGSSSKSDTTEDSGVIDLKALAAGADSSVNSDLVVPGDGGLFQLSAPIGMGAPAPAVVAPIEPPPKNRTPLFIGAGIAIAGIAIAGAFFGMKGSGDQPIAPTTTQAATEATPPPLDTQPTPTAEASATATASATASASVAKPKWSGPKPGGTAKTSGTGASTGAATPAPAKSPCGCAAGDLMCNIQCSAKKK